jgi:catechol 2,3-dioxygenase-like lactoylglutathione lyase family enzyme
VFPGNELAKKREFAHLRVARATDHLEQIVSFYRDGLGLQVVASFDDHDGFDGVMLGHPGAQYHLEFTRHRGEMVGRAPNQESLLVFYLPDGNAWQTAVQRMVNAGYEPVAAHNPYWDVRGVTFEDADGYRVVLQHAAWEN